MPIAPASGATLLGTGVLANGLQLRVRTPSQAGGQLGSESDGGALSRIRSLVDGLSRKIVAEARKNDNARAAYLQRSFDSALAEVAQLLGSELLLGGPENAAFAGINRSQLASVHVRKLPPWGAVRFDGLAVVSPRPASVLLEDIENLLSRGGSLTVQTRNGNTSIGVAAGSSKSGLVRSLNRLGLGVTAETTTGGIRLLRPTSGFGDRLRVVSRAQRWGAGGGDYSFSGNNPSQIETVELSNIPTGQYALVGSRDSLATKAELVYTGSAGLVNGSATFDLTGSLGTANFSAVEGETVAQFAARINSETETTGIEASVSGDQVFLRSNETGDAASIQISNIVPESEPSVSGVNAGQLVDFVLHDIPEGTTVTLDGSITRAAEKATQTYHGGAGATVVDTATFTLSGSLGSSQITITQGESLVDVRQRINDLSAQTGVVAEVVGNDLRFESQDYGASESVQVVLNEISEEVLVSGVNASQITDFTVLSNQRNSSQQLNGTVTQAATRGELTYRGVFGANASAGTFLLTGETGSATISVTHLESLTSIRDKINAETANTGVSASVSGSTLTLQSASYGSAGIVEVDVLSGDFTTEGGDGNGNAAGLDAELTINGDAVTASGLDVGYSDSFGSYAFTLAAGFSGTLDTITVTATDGAFDVTGGDANGIDYGVDAEAIINGQTVNAVGDTFSTTIDTAQFSFRSVEGFSGVFDTITLGPDYDAFDIQGGDANGLANGQDGQATINGTAYFSNSNEFVVPISYGDATIRFADGFLGSFDDVTLISKNGGTLSTRTYEGFGSAAHLQLDGKNVRSENGEYILEKNGTVVAIRLADGLRGALDAFEVRAAGNIESASQFEPLSGADRDAVAEALTDLFTIASGGELSGFSDQFAAALNATLEASSRLRNLSGESTFLARSLSTGALVDLLA